MREFLRHPSDIPVDVRILRDPDSRQAQLKDISVAGLCCRVSRPIASGSHVEFTVPSLDSDYCGRGIVIWCRPLEESYQLGIQFLSDRDSYRARMVAQLCQIEHYRREVEHREGRYMDGEQAAMEWINRYAEDFNQHYPGV